MQCFSLLRSLIFAAIFIALQVWYFPRWAGIRGHASAPLEETWRWAGVVLASIGIPLMLACVLRFGTTGEGTPFPADPPRKFVAVGPYRYSRNPMYVGMGLTLLGEAMLFADWGQWQRIAIYAAVLVAVTFGFVLLYEEPTLRVKFGDEYEEYCVRVHRWFGRAGVR